MVNCQLTQKVTLEIHPKGHTTTIQKVLPQRTPEAWQYLGAFEEQQDQLVGLSGDLKEWQYKRWSLLRKE